MKTINLNLTPLIKASQTIGKVIQPGAVVVYESTVYPGVTEEVCGPAMRSHGHSNTRRYSSCQNQMEFSPLYSRFSWRSLYKRRRACRCQVGSGS